MESTGSTPATAPAPRPAIPRRITVDPDTLAAFVGRDHFAELQAAAMDLGDRMPSYLLGLLQPAEAAVLLPLAAKLLGSTDRRRDQAEAVVAAAVRALDQIPEALEVTR